MALEFVFHALWVPYTDSFGPSGTTVSKVDGLTVLYLFLISLLPNISLHISSLSCLLDTH